MLWCGTTRNQESRGIRPRGVNRIHQARVSLEGHPWSGCCPEVIPGVHIVMDRPSKKRGLNNVGQVNPKDCYLSRKDSGLQGGDIQVVKPCKCEAMHLVDWVLTPMGHCNPKEVYANVIASTNHLEILCFVTGPPLARLPKPTKSCSDFLYEAERSMYTLRALTGQSRDSWLPVRGRNLET